MSQKSQKIAQIFNLKQEQPQDKKISNKQVIPKDQQTKVVMKEKENAQNLKKISHQNYDPKVDSPFEFDTNVPFSFMSDAFEMASQCKGENSQLIKKNMLSNMFLTIMINKPTDLVYAYNICILKLAPDFRKLELGIGDGILQKAISKESGKTLSWIRDQVSKLGDLGDVAELSRKNQTKMDTFFIKKVVEVTKLSLVKVFESFKQIAQTSGNKTEIYKEMTLMKMFADSQGYEVKYLVRWAQGNLKIGAALSTMQSSLSRAFYAFIQGKKLKDVNFDEKYDNFENMLKKCYCECPDQEFLIDNLLKLKDIKELAKIMKLTVGIPCQPMLAKPLREIQMIFKRFENQKFSCEYKYDGLRGQIHYQNKQCKIFSRNLLDMTDTYPDIIEFLVQNLPAGVNDFILDSEIVAYDVKNQRILPFQTLSNRGRKGVNKEDIEIQVCLFMFDLLYLNGKSLLQETLQVRRDTIKEHFIEVQGKLHFATHSDTDDIEEIQTLLNSSVKDGCEGLMVKSLDQNSTYEPSKRTFKWLKLKKDYLNTGLGDTFDLVPIGAFYGQGKRTGFYGSYLLACYNKDFERYETICKAGTGFSDEDLEQFHSQLKDHVIKQPLSEYNVKDFKADVWFNPITVWEIRGADIQVSPNYTCAINELGNDKGLGMRFPRLIKVRSDKNPEEATTNDQIYEIYASQPAVSNQQDLFNDDEYY